jgi:uracil-DNA glycosylase
VTRRQRIPVGLLARHLRQQGELGGDPIFLSDLSARELMELVEAVRIRSMGAPDHAQERGGSGTPKGGKPLEGGPRSPGRAKGSPSGDPIRAPKVPGELEGPSPDGYEALRAEALACTRCNLAETRTNVVFSDGTPGARLMVVGEAPGAQEDKTGLAFVGPAGKLLDLLLGSVGLSRGTSAYICNVLKCRPPGNRNPLPGEIEACSPFLARQIELIGPKAILALGAFAGHYLSGREESLGQLRGEVYSYEGVPVVVTYHPAALLRNPGWTRSTWEDLQLLRQIMDGA